MAAESPHSDYVHCLAAAGIVQGGPGGTSADTHGPALEVRRDQMASFLLRAMEFASDAELGSQAQAFTDVGRATRISPT
jgi:hypothetical protein